MVPALIGLALVLIVAIAADYRVMNALICLFTSIYRRALTPVAKGKDHD